MIFRSWRMFSALCSFGLVFPEGLKSVVLRAFRSTGEYSRFVQALVISTFTLFLHWRFQLPYDLLLFTLTCCPFYSWSSLKFYQKNSSDSLVIEILPFRSIPLNPFPNIDHVFRWAEFLEHDAWLFFFFFLQASGFPPLRESWTPYNLWICNK